MNNLNIVVEPPIKGQWAILNPPGHPEAVFDFLIVNDKKMLHNFRHLFLHLFATIPVTATYAWTQPVFAPVDGQVVACSDSSPDRKRISMIRDLFRLLLFQPKAGCPLLAYGGNNIVLRCGGVYALFTHLKMGSLRVRVGDFVCSGQQLAEAGNSGSSIQPHLHFQVMRNENHLPLFQALWNFKLHGAQKRAGRV